MPSTLLLLLLAVAPYQMVAQALQTYDLPLGREIKVMDEYLIEARSVRISRLSIRDPNGVSKVMADDTVTINLSANCGVQAVTEDGQEAIKLVKVRNASAVVNSEYKSLVPTGTSLKAEFSDAGSVLTINKHLVDAKVNGYLLSVIRPEGGLRTGTIMNADAPVAVGETWPINKRAFLGTLDITDSTAVDRVEGYVKFVSIDSSSIRPVAVVTMIVTAIDVLTEIEGRMPSTSKIETEITLVVPLDKRYPLVRTNTRMRVTASFSTGPGSASVEFITIDETHFLR